jgi:hypothetical protein
MPQKQSPEKSAPPQSEQEEDGAIERPTVHLATREVHEEDLAAWDRVS